MDEGKGEVRQGADGCALITLVAVVVVLAVVATSAAGCGVQTPERLGIVCKIITENEVEKSEAFVKSLPNGDSGHGRVISDSVCSGAAGRHCTTLYQRVGARKSAQYARDASCFSKDSSLLLPEQDSMATK